MAGPLPRDHIATIAEKLRDDHLGLFVGAGFSRLAPALDGSPRRLPLWAELADRVARACNVRAKAYPTLLQLFDGIAGKRDRPTLDRAVREALDDKPYDLAPAHQVLKELPWTAVFTTNYDGLLQRAFGTPVFAEDRDYEKLAERSGEKPLLFHLHGTLDWPHTLTRDDYRLWRDKHPRAFLNLQKFVHDKTLLFIGYSLSDPHIDELLALMRDITAGRPKEMFAWMWRLTKEHQELLAADKIHAFSIRKEEDWAKALTDILAVLAAGASPPKTMVGLDPYAYDRQQYVAAMEVRYGFANLQGLYVGGAGYARTDVSLEEVFVEPDLETAPVAILGGEGGGPADGMSLRRALSQRAKEGENEQGARQHIGRREPAMQVLAREAKLLIVGAPGEGKSTLLRRVLLQAAARWRERPDTEPFPVLVKLADWQTEEGPSEGRLARYVESRLPTVGEIGSLAVAAWLKGPVLWLLDGIDEIRDPGERGRFADEVRATSVQWPHHRWVIATRPAGEPSGGLGAAWTRAALPSLSDPQIEQVLARWGRVLKTKEGLMFDARRVAADLKRDPGLRQVRGNALLLTLAILFFKTRKRLPHDRWEFYAAADASLRDTWVAHRIREAQRYLPGDYLLELLDHLALEGMIEGRVLFDRATLKETAKAVLAARGYTGGEQDKEAEKFLEAAEDLIGVLVAQAPDRFGFLHLTFQEFYAARAIARKGDEERATLIARFWDHPDWREVWPLYALAVQNEPAKYQHLFATIGESGHELDQQLYRPRFACLRLAGVGTAPMPPAVASVTVWALDELAGRDWRLLGVLDVLGAWERRHTEGLRAAVLARLADDDGIVRSLAAEALAGAVDEVEVRAAVLARLADDDGNVRKAAAQALAGAVGEAEVRAAVLARLADDDGNVREAAAQVLAGAVGEAEVRAAVLARLADDDGNVRGAAAQVLAGAVGEAEVRAAVLAGLADDDGNVREAAAQVLAVVAGEAKVRTALLDRLADVSAWVRRAAVKALAGAMNETEVRAAVLATLSDDDWFVRSGAVQAVAGAVSEPEVRAAVLVRLCDYDGWVRRWAVQALAGAVGEAEVRAAILARLADDDVNVRRTALQALVGAVGDVEVRAAILARLADDDVNVRGAAVQALAGAVGEAEVRAALLARLADDEWSMRGAAVLALAGAVGEAEVRAAILARLADDEWTVRGAAVVALAGWVVAEKFGLPAGEVVPAYP